MNIAPPKQPTAYMHHVRRLEQARIEVLHFRRSRPQIAFEGLPQDVAIELADALHGFLLKVPMPIAVHDKITIEAVRPVLQEALALTCARHKGWSEVMLALFRGKNESLDNPQHPILLVNAPPYGRLIVDLYGITKDKYDPALRQPFIGLEHRSSSAQSAVYKECSVPECSVPTSAP